MDQYNINNTQVTAKNKRRFVVPMLMALSMTTLSCLSIHAFAATGLPIGNKIPINRAIEGSVSDLNRNQASASAASGQPSDQAKELAYDDIRNEAFKKLLKNTAPMSPEQIRKLHSVMAASKKVVAEPDMVPAKGTSNTIIVDVSPGAAAPVIRLSRGYVTAVRFLDATGQPWPIQAYDIGNGSLFDVHWDQKGNTLFMESNTDYQKSNMMVQLRGLSAPIMLNLIPGQDAMDYRDDLRVNAMGPNALTESDMSIPDAVNQTLSQVLNGVKPHGTQQVATSMMDTSAYEATDKSAMYLRLPKSMKLLSPAWISYLSSDDGVQAYKLPLASTIVIMQHGQIQQFTIQGL